MIYHQSRIEISNFIGDISDIRPIWNDFEYELSNKRNSGKILKILPKYRRYIGLESINWWLNRSWSDVGNNRDKWKKSTIFQVFFWKIWKFIWRSDLNFWWSNGSNFTHVFKSSFHFILSFYFLTLFIFISLILFLKIIITSLLHFFLYLSFQFYLILNVFILKYLKYNFTQKIAII